MRKSLYLSLFFLFLCCLIPCCALADGASVSGQVWYDNSGSGLYTEGARALSKVAVALHRLESDGSSTLVAQQTTDSSGTYAFTGLNAGEYFLEVTLPDDHQFVFPQEGGSVILPASGKQSRSLPFTLSAGQARNDMHIGASKASCYIKAFIFEDKNQNGGRSTAETMLRGVPVVLYYEANGEWLPIASATSDREGCATFWDLTPGTYRLSAELPQPYIIGPLGEKVNGWYNSIPPCDSSFGMTEPFTVARGTSLGVGVGAVSTGSVSGVIWHDVNLNGRFEATEGGYAGATVTLTSESAGVSRSVTTDESGSYRFDLLLAGDDYILAVALPESAMFTLPGGDSLFTEGYAFTQSAKIKVYDQSEAQVQSIGVIPVSTLTVQLYNDLNANGSYDADEPVFAGARVEVLTEDTVRAAAVSDGAGTAFIPVVRGGECFVRCILPAGQVFTVAGVQNDFTALAATGDLTIPCALAHGENTLLYAGVTLPAAVSGMLFNDKNITGVQDGGEAGLPGFTVQAINADGDVVAQTETDENGRYAFNSLLPAMHTVRFLLTDAYVFTEYSETGAAVENNIIFQSASYGEAAPLHLLPGQSVSNINGGIFRSATVSGAVLLSTGLSSLPVKGGMENVQITLLDEYGAPVSDTTTTYTDAEGSFYLKGALPGTYMLEYLLPANAAFTQPETGAESIVSAPFTVGSADDLHLEPLYAIHTGTLSGVIYQDENLSGAYEADEPVFSGIRLTLENTDLGLIYETSTLDNGQYIFDLLRPGAYTIHAALPEDFCFAVDASSPFPALADENGIASLRIDVGDQQNDRNIAVIRPASLNGLVFFDRDNDGQRADDDPGAAKVTVALRSVYGTHSYTLQTDETGRFCLDALVPGEYTLRVTLESDCIPANGNDAVLIDGFWTSNLLILPHAENTPEYAILRYGRIAGRVWNMGQSDDGVAGRSITLYENGAPLAAVQTNAQGAFSFGSLKPGNYAISCDLPDENYRFARTADTAEQPSIILGDVSRQENGAGYSADFTLSMGEHKTNCHIGIGAMGILGDTAWIDENGNGLQDAGEPNLPGVKIALYQYGELVAETETDVFGHYQIRDLYPGLYTVRVTMPKEVKATVRVTTFPMVASVLEASEDTTAEAAGILVPSGSRNLNCDFGFVLRKEGQYPASLELTPATNWDYNN